MSGNRFSPAANLVEDSAPRGNRSPGFKYSVLEDSGLQERGETGLHGLKYPAPEDSRVYIHINKQERVETGSPGLSGAGRFRSTDLEARGNRFTSNNPAPEDCKEIRIFPVLQSEHL